MDVKHAKELLLRERERLQQLEEQIEDTGDLDESQQESSGALTSHDQHVGDTGSQTFQRERSVSIAERLERKRSEVSEAIDRIEEDRYGQCEVCGRQISDERLEALPATRYCSEHPPDVEDDSVAAEGGWSLTQELGPNGDG